MRLRHFLATGSELTRALKWLRSTSRSITFHSLLSLIFAVLFEACQEQEECHEQTRKDNIDRNWDWIAGASTVHLLSGVCYRVVGIVAIHDHTGFHDHFTSWGSVDEIT